MTKIIITIIMIWLLVRLFRSPMSKKQSRTTPKRETPRPTQPEGTTTLTRVSEPKKKVVDASTAENAHYEEVE